MNTLKRKSEYRYLYSSGRITKNNTNENLFFESMNERSFLSLLVFDLKIKSIKSQPFTIKWHNGIYKAQYTPDILVEYVVSNKEPDVTQTMVFELKPLKILSEEWDIFSARFKMATKWCRERGYLFKLITEKYIDTPYLSNVNFLLQYDQSRFPASSLGAATDIESMVNKILIHQHLSINELLQFLSQDKTTQQQLLPYIWMLVRDGRLNVDLTTPLTMKTLIWNGEPPFDYNFEQSPIRRRLRSRIITP